MPLIGFRFEYFTHVSFVFHYTFNRLLLSSKIFLPNLCQLPSDSLGISGGTLLKVKPVLSIQNGEVVPVGRVRTRQRAIEDIIARCADLRPVEHLFVLHSTTPEESDYVRDRVAALDATAPITIGRVTPVVGVHGGPGILGVGVVTAPDAQTAALGGK